MHGKVTGVDINEACVRFGNNCNANAGIRFICADYKKPFLQR